MQYSIERSDGSARVAMTGRLVFSDADLFRELLITLKGLSETRWIFLLDKLDFIDSGGLGMFLMIREEAEKSGKSVILKTPVGNVKKVLDLAHFSQLLTIEP